MLLQWCGSRGVLSHDTRHAALTPSLFSSTVVGALRDTQSTKCASLESLPSITFVLFGGKGKPPARVTLKPADYSLQFRVPAGPSVPSEECSLAQYHHPDGAGIDASRCKLDCVTGIAPDADTMWTFGQVFLRNFYVVFDRDNDRIGIAPSAKPGSI